MRVLRWVSSSVLSLWTVGTGVVFELVTASRRRGGVRVETAIERGIISVRIAVGIHSGDVMTSWRARGRVVVVAVVDVGM